MNVHLVGRNRYAIVWDPDKTKGEVRLLRSEHIHDKYRKVATVTDASQYIDVPQDKDGNTYPPTRFREWYYKIKHETGEIGPSYVRGVPDRRALEVARLAWRHLKRDIRSKAYHLPRPTTGERCEKCWDENRKQRIRSKCQACGGTGFQKGYARPAEVFVSFDDKKVHPEDMPNMKMAKGQHKMWTANEPVVRDGDFLIRKRDMEIYEVLRVQPTTKTGLIVRQPMMCRVVEKSNVKEHVLNESDSAHQKYIEKWEYEGESGPPFE